MGFVFPCSSQKIPATATAQPASSICSCEKFKPDADVSFGNGHKLVGMNLFTRQHRTNGDSQAENRLVRFVWMVAIR